MRMQNTTENEDLYYDILNIQQRQNEWATSKAGYMVDFTIDNGHYKVGGALQPRKRTSSHAENLRLLLVGRRALGYTFLKSQKLF